FRIPFNGDSNIFHLRPSKVASILPYGKIHSNQIQVEYKIPKGGNGNDIKSELENNLELIKEYLSYLDLDIQSFNKILKKGIKQALENRKSKLDNDDSIASNLGYPIK